MHYGIRTRPDEEGTVMPNRARAFIPALAVIAAVPAAAALPPNHQRLAELRAVLAHPGVTRALDDAPIERVEHVGPDRYRVTSGRCHIDVTIVDLPTPRDVAGPRGFEARPGERVCGGETR